MYLGQNKIAIQSQEWICEALFRLIQTTDYDKITITAICTKAGVSRQTFYKLFQTKEEIIQYYLADFLAIPCEYAMFLKQDKTRLLDYYFNTIEQKRETIKLLFQKRLEHLLLHQIETNFGFIHDQFGNNNSVIPINISSDFFCFGLIGLTRAFIENEDLTTEDIVTFGRQLLKTVNETHWLTQFINVDKKQSLLVSEKHISSLTKVQLEYSNNLKNLTKTVGEIAYRNLKK